METERLILREYTADDFDALFEIMSDPETMRHYPAPFDEAKTRGWIEWNLDNYRKYGWGLWAVILKESGDFIGDCGITLQNIDGEQLPEIGYHINKKYWRRGFAKEAARAVRDWFFENTGYDVMYSYMKHTNAASCATALANGMKKVKEYPDPKNGISYAYAITRGEWQELKEITFDTATKADIAELVRLRIAYMTEDLGAVSDHDRECMQGQLPGYFERRLGKELVAFVARAEKRLVAAAYLLVIEKPASPSLPNGLDSEVLSVYTEEAYRGKGICSHLMRDMIEWATAHGICRIDLLATQDGYPVYKRAGFAEKTQKYVDMRLKLK